VNKKVKKYNYKKKYNDDDIRIIKMPLTVTTHMGKNGRKMMSTMNGKKSTAMSVKPMRGGGSGNALLGVAPSSMPPFQGKEQLDTQAFYSIGRGAVGLPTPPQMKGEMGKIADRLSKLHIKEKPIRKNIKINF